MMNKATIKEVSYYIITIILCAGFLFWVLRLWMADLAGWEWCLFPPA